MAEVRPQIDSVLLIGFGGPTRPGDILPFLKIVTCGRGVPEARLKDVEHHYLEVGGKSPYNERTELLRQALERWLSERGHELPIYTGMRNWNPFMPDTIQRMNRDGRKSCAGVILAAHRSEASWGRYQEDVRLAILTNHGVGPEVRYTETFYDHPRFLEANAQRIEEATGFRRGEWPEGVPILFTAHSIPVRMRGAETYKKDLLVSCRGVASLLGTDDWELCYQSRSGDPRTPWLEPDINDALRNRAEAGSKEVVVQAIGFLSDHVEVLFDLDIEAVETCQELGISMHRAPCVNDHPEFVALLGERILEVAGLPV
jgi:ferrochelatase